MPAGTDISDRWLFSRANLAAALVFASLVSAGSLSPSRARADAAANEPPHSAALDAAIAAAAKRHGVPERLVRRIIMRESKYNPRAHNRAFWGLMQISYPTARSMGFRGSREELLNPFVNLRYAVPYLANAFRIAERREDMAVRLYAAGYYFTARSKGLLSVLRTADSPPMSGEIEAPQQPILAANAVAQPPQSVGFFGALFSPGRQPAPQAAPAEYAANVAPAPAAAAPNPQGDAAGPAPTATAGADLPKKWRKDGGVTVIARGEQAAPELAERRARTADASDDAPKSRKHHGKKITLAANLDIPLTSAPAYASAPQQDPRFAASPSQAAIESATTAEASRQGIQSQGVQAAAGTPGETLAVRETETTRVARSTDGEASKEQTKTAGKSAAKATVKPTVKTASKSAPKPTKVARRHKDETRQALADKPLDLLPTR